MNQSVKLETVTPNAEAFMVRCARVSNPENQDNPEFSKLLSYCIEHEHWSIFEHAHMTVEINTTRAIAAQILRHRSFCFQEFSQRYSDVSKLGVELVVPELRKQSSQNRQSSQNGLEVNVEKLGRQLIKDHFDNAMDLYKGLLDLGVAKECARFVLPLATATRLYMTGSCRSWIHYINLRTEEGTQKEHREIAGQCLDIFVEQFPHTAKALWTT